MLLKDILPLEFANRNIIVKEYGRFTPEEFLHEMNRFSKINKQYQRVLDFLEEKGYIFGNKESVETDFIESVSEEVIDINFKSRLEAIPLEALKYYDKFEDSTIVDMLINRAIDNFWKLYQLNESAIYNLPSIWDTRAAKIYELQQEMIENLDTIECLWKEKKSHHYLPTNLDANHGLTANLQMAIEEIIPVMANYYRISYPRKKVFPYKKQCPTLECLFISNHTVDETASIVGLSGQQVYNHMKVLKDFFAGEMICENYFLHKNIVSWIKSIEKSCLWNTKSNLVKFIGDADENLLFLLGYDFTDDAYSNHSFVVPKSTKGVYSKFLKVAIKTLRDIVLPIDKEELLLRIEQSKDYEYNDGNEYILNNLLLCDDVIETPEDGMYQLCDGSLTTDQQKLARLIYNHKECRKLRSEWIDLFEEKYHHRPTTQFTILNDYGINNQGNYWHYGEGKESTKSIVDEYVSKNIIFHFDDLIEYLKNQGCVFNSDTVRTYVTECCKVDNKAPEHFCHKAFVDDYKEYSWRTASRSGLFNWILNQIKDAITGKEKLLISDIIDFVSRKADGTNYAARIVERVKTAIKQYSGEGEPFVVQDEYLKINPQNFNSTDFETIGLKGGKYPFFSQIRALASNEVKHSSDGKLLFTDFIDIVNANLEEEQDYNTIRRAIENPGLSPIDVKLQNIDDRLYIVRTSSTLKAEENFVAESADSIEIELKPVAEEKPRSVNYRSLVDWQQLLTMLKRELTFYGYWMAIDNIQLDDAIDKFARFIQTSGNSNLSKKIPQNLFEYWFANTDALDRSTYLCNLALFYEPLLADMKCRKENTVLTRKKGLGEWIYEYPQLNYALNSNYKESRGFDRILKDLYYKRNKYAHGEPVELTTTETVKFISDFVALYIYTVAKYA